MRIRYFADSDTLYIALREGEITETRDLDENILLDLDGEGSVCAITCEHASRRMDIGHLQVEGMDP